MNYCSYCNQWYQGTIHTCVSQWSFPTPAVISRNYKCPKCNGEFNYWDVHDNKDCCPFCLSVRGEYSLAEKEKSL